MTKFGQGKYYLGFVKDKLNVEYSIFDFEDDQSLIEILSDPPLDSADYLTKSILYKTLLEFRVIDNEVRFLLNNFKNQYLEKILVGQEYQEIIFGKKFFHIYLPAIKQVPGLHHVFVDEHGKIVAKVILSRNSVTNRCQINIYSHESLILYGSNTIHALNIHCSNSVIINDDLKTRDELFIHAKSILTPDEYKISSKKIILQCEEECDISGKLQAENIEIRAGKYLGKGVIESNQLLLIAEEAEQYSTIKARQFLSLVCLDWISHFGAKIHAPSGMNILAREFTDNSFTFANQFTLYATSAILNGIYYLGKAHIIKTEILLKVSQKAKFICSGFASHQSDTFLKITGNFYYSPNLEIYWERIFIPQFGSEICALVEDNNLPIYIDRNGLDKIFPKEKGAISMHTDFYIELAGNILIDNADFFASSTCLMNIAGFFLQKHAYQPQQIILSSKILDTKDSSIFADKLALESSMPFVQNNHLSGNQLIIKSESYKADQLASIHFNNLQIKSKDKIFFEKGSVIEVKETAALTGRRIWTKTNSFQSGTLLQEADFYALNTGHIKTKLGYTIAPLVGSFGRITAEQYSVHACASMISGFNSIGIFNDNSIVSCSPGLFIQNQLRWPTVTGATLALVNAGLTVAGLACPAILPATTLVKFSINGVAQAVNTYRQVKNIKPYLGNPSKSSTANTIRMVTAVSQCLMTAGYAVNATVVNGQALRLSAPAMEAPPVGTIVQSTLANGLSMFSGYNNYSLININPGIIMGAGSANYSLINISANGMFGLSSVNNSLYNVDAGFSATLGSNLNSGYAAYVTGNQYSVLGQSVYNYNRLTLDPVASLPYSNWSIVTDDLAIKRSVTFENSHISAHHISEHHGLSLQASQLSGDQLSVQKNEALTLDKSSLHLNHLKVAEQSAATMQQSHASINDVDNQGHIAIANSHLTISALNNESRLVIQHSEIKAEKVVNAGDLLAINNAFNINQLHNTHNAQLIDTQASIHEIKNEEHGAFALDGSSVGASAIHNAQTADLALRASRLEAKTVHNEGQLHIDDSFARIAAITNTGHIQADNAWLHCPSLSLNSTDLHFTQTTVYNAGAGPTAEETQAFMESTPRLYYDINGLYYKANHDLALNQRTIHSLLPVNYSAPTLTLSGEFNVNTTLGLYADNNLHFDHANLRSTANIYGFAQRDLALIESNLNAKQEILLNSHDSLSTIHSTLQAREVGLHADKCNIDIAATCIEAQNYFEAVADSGSVVIEYTAKPIQGRYDMQYEWDPSVIASGQGIGHDHVGIAISAGRDVQVQGSTLASQGDNYIRAQGNDNFSPAYHPYVSNVKTEHGPLGFSSRQVMTTDYQLLQSNIISTHGKNTVVGTNVASTATNFLSKDGNDLYAKQDVLLFDVVASKETKTYRTSFWGASASLKKETTQESIPTVVANYDPGSTHVHAGETVQSRGTVFSLTGSGDIKGNRVEILAGKTTQTVSVSSHQIGVSAFNMPLVGSEHPIMLPLTDPTYANIEMLLNSSNTTESLVNGVSTTANLISSYADMQKAFNTQQIYSALAGRYNVPILTEPNITLTWSQSSAKYSYQTTSGSIKADQLNIRAEEKLHLEVPTQVTADMNIAATEANLVAPRLESSMHSSTSTISISSNADGNLSGSFSQHKSDTYTETSAALPIQVGGTLHVAAQTLNVAAQVEANALTGEVKNLNIFTPADTTTTRSSSTSLDTHGRISHQQEKAQDASYNNSSYIQINRGLSQAFKADNVNLQNARMTGENNLSANIVHHQTFNAKHEHHQHGMMLNAQDIQKSIHYIQPAEQRINQEVMNILEVKSLNDAYDKINTTYCLSKDIYDPTRDTLADCGFAAKDVYTDPNTGMLVTVYENATHQEAVITFRGTSEPENLLSAGQIAIGSIPQDTQTAEFNSFMAEQISAYQAKGYDLLLTGHSLGATQASIASANYQIPAVVFDNPGVPKNLGLDLSGVISFQAPPNAINSLAEVNLHAYDYGTKIDLPMTAQQQAVYAASTLVAAVVPGTGLFSVPATTLNSHSIVNLGSQLNQWENAARL